jgi:hypothetical protein
MADNKKNDIIEEQRRARAEFLRLKKMQNGEIDAGPKPSEVAIVPKTPKEKWDNFWFQYKWWVFTAVASVIVLSILIVQCASRVEPDMEIIYFTYTPVMDQQLGEVSEYFEGMTKDINDDGEVNVQIINCSISEKGNTQYTNTMLQKMQAMIAANEKALLFITDSKSIKYFDKFNEGSHIFDGEPLSLGEEFYTSTEHKDFGPLPEGLTISIRRVSDTLLEENKSVSKYQKEAIRIIEKLESKNSK